jgi:uncharacterized SAM-binding protein YcdF (DUF218 family)
MVALVALVLVGGVLFLTPLRRLLIGATLGLGLLWLAVCYTPLSQQMVRPLVRVDTLPDRADAIFVFSSSLQYDGELTATSMARLLRGLELLGQGRAPLLVVSELPPPSHSYAAAARALMDHLGMRGELQSVGPIHNTHDEAAAVARLCAARGARRVIAVTSPTHLRRAAATLEHHGLTVFAAPAVETRYDLENLERVDDRLQAFGAALHDLIGFEVYRLRGFIDPPR